MLSRHFLANTMAHAIHHLPQIREKNPPRDSGSLEAAGAAADDDADGDAGDDAGDDADSGEAMSSARAGGAADSS